MNYDSKAESIAAKFFEPLGYRRPGNYEFINAELYDQSGQPFKAKIDFIPYDPLDCMVEFKTSGLNSHKTKFQADKALHDAKNNPYRTRGQTAPWLEQLHSWNNSAYKHSEQQRKLPPLSQIIVFSVWPTYENIKLYNKLGILWCHRTGFTKLNSYCRATRNGLPINYIARTPDGQEVTFPLHSIMEWQATHSEWSHKTAPKREWEAAGFQSAKQRKKKTSQLNQIGN